jgi:aspartate carbamoyltransferase catalytic subunit
MKHLGGEVLSFENMETTSVTKGESLYDTVKMMERYADVIVIRHNLEGAARFTAESSERPVINAGDGANQHPTQTLLDLFTVQECQKKLNNLTIAMVGDLKYGRTVHSLAQAMSHFKSRFYFISPEILKMPESIKEELREKKIKFSELESFDRILNKVDILYMTRIQKERFADPLDYEKVKNAFILKAEDLNKVKPNLKVLHPLPRVNEIDKKVDDTKHAYYFQQAQNGLYLRQALLALLLNKIS